MRAYREYLIKPIVVNGRRVDRVIFNDKPSITSLSLEDQLFLLGVVESLDKFELPFVARSEDGWAMFLIRRRSNDGLAVQMGCAIHPDRQELVILDLTLRRKRSQGTRRKLSRREVKREMA